VPFDVVRGSSGHGSRGEPLAQFEHLFQDRFDIAFGVCFRDHHEASLL